MCDDGGGVNIKREILIFHDLSHTPLFELKYATVISKKEVALGGRRVGNRISRKGKKNGDIQTYHLQQLFLLLC